MTIKPSGTLDLFDCGDDFVCGADDPQVHQYVMPADDYAYDGNTTVMVFSVNSCIRPRMTMRNPKA